MNAVQWNVGKFIQDTPNDGVGVGGVVAGAQLV